MLFFTTNISFLSCTPKTFRTTDANNTTNKQTGVLHSYVNQTVQAVVQ